MTHQQLQQTFGGEAMGAHGASLIHSTGLPHTSWPVKQAGQPHPTLSDSVVLEPRRREQQHLLPHLLRYFVDLRTTDGGDAPRRRTLINAFLVRQQATSPHSC